jgi:hypothetical protein
VTKISKDLPDTTQIKLIPSSGESNASRVNDLPGPVSYSLSPLEGSKCGIRSCTVQTEKSSRLAEYLVFVHIKDYLLPAKWPIPQWLQLCGSLIDTQYSLFFPIELRPPTRSATAKTYRYIIEHTIGLSQPMHTAGESLNLLSPEHLSPGQMVILLLLLLCVFVCVGAKKKFAAHSKVFVNPPNGYLISFPQGGLRNVTDDFQIEMASITWMYVGWSHHHT